MPHATETMSSNHEVNGDRNSKFLSHVTSYPVVNDSIEGFKQHPYGKKSLELADGAYQRFGKPVEPYLETPYNYAKPYVNKADELADSGLNQVDSRFPIVKKDTNTVVDTAKSYVFWPFQLANDGKDYVFSTWNDEYQKTANHNNRGTGLQTSVMALISTELKIASDFFQAIADFLGPKYEESKQQAEHYKQVGQQKASEYQQFAHQKSAEYQQLAQDKLDEYTKAGQQKGEQIKQQAQGMKEEAKKK